MVETDDVSQNNNKKSEVNKEPMRPLMLSSGLIVFLIVCLLRVALTTDTKGGFKI